MCTPCIIASKLDYTFGTIGNATADRRTAKVVEKLEPFLAWRILTLNTWSCSEACQRNVEHSPLLEWNLLLLNFLSHFLYLVPVFGNSMFLKWTVTCTQYFCIFNLQRPQLQVLCLLSLFTLLKYSLESYWATTEPLRKEVSGY